MTRPMTDATSELQKTHAATLREYDRRIAMLAANTAEVKITGDLNVRVSGTFATYDLGIAYGLRVAADIVLNGTLYDDARPGTPTGTLRTVYEDIIAKRAALGHGTAKRAKSA